MKELKDARDLIKKGHFGDYKILAFRNIPGKRSYDYGDNLFEFLEFCKTALPESANYDFAGVEKLSLEDRRAVYYLYPHIKKGKADFLLIYNKPAFKKEGYRLYKKLDNFRFILERI